MRVFTIATVLMLAMILAGCKSGGDTTASTAPDQGATTTTTAGGDSSGATTTAGADTAGAAGGSAEASGNSLVGKWEVTNQPNATISYEFKDDGTCQVVVSDMKLADSPVKGKVTMTSDETYKLDGDKLTMQVTGIDATSDNDADKAQMDMMNKGLADKVKSATQQNGTVTWKGKDDAVLNMTQDGKQLEVDLKRQAS